MEDEEQHKPGPLSQLGCADQRANPGDVDRYGAYHTDRDTSDEERHAVRRRRGLAQIVDGGGDAAGEAQQQHRHPDHDEGKSTPEKSSHLGSSHGRVAPFCLPALGKMRVFPTPWSLGACPPHAVNSGEHAHNAATALPIGGFAMVKDALDVPATRESQLAGHSW